MPALPPLLRSILVTFCTAAFLVAVFWGVVWRAEVPGTAGPRDPIKPVDVPQDDSATIVGQGDGAWLRVYDQGNGRLVSEYRFGKFEPGDGGPVDVNTPQARFYLEDGRHIELDAASGVIERAARDQDSPPSAESFNAAEALPTRGSMRDVVIRVFVPDDESPVLVARIPNLGFDMDGNRIFTIDSDRMPADQVPIEVDGRDVTFRGRGLAIHWAENFSRLELLEIHHGEQLTVRSASSALAISMGFSPARALASIGQPPLPQAVTYRAIFREKVEVLEGQQRVASGDVLMLDASPRGTETSSPTEPGAKPAEPSPTETANNAPSTAAESYTVLWTGPLKVAAMDTAALPPDTFRLRLAGVPAMLSRDGAELTAGEVRYDGRVQQAELWPSTQHPTVRMADARTGIELNLKGHADGSTDTPLMTLDRLSGTATLRGPGDATLPLSSLHKSTEAARSPDATERLHVGWAQSCLIHFREHAAAAMTIDDATLHGQVSIKHPQLEMTSNRLTLLTDPDSAEPKLKEVHAEGDVKASFKTAADGENQTLRADTLDAFAPAGMTADAMPIERLSARGHVTSEGPQGKLSAGTLEATLDTNANADVPLKNLRAEGGVTFAAEDGTRAVGHELVIASVNGVQMLTLRGEADKPASLSSPRGEIHGEVIRGTQDGSAVIVEGPGNIRMQGEDGQTLTASWAQSLKRTADVVDLLGDVTAEVTQPDGKARLTAGAAQLQLKPGEGDRESIRVAKLIAKDNVIVEARSSMPNGTRQLNVWAEQVEAFPESRQLTVPGPGSMLYTVTSTEKPTPPKPGVPNADAAGVTAVSWQTSLSADQDRGAIDAVGDVKIVHEPAGQAEGKLNLRTDRLAARADAKGSLSSAEAHGNLELLSRSIRVKAGHAVYNAGAQTLTVTGSDTSDVQILDDSGFSRGSAEKVIYDVQGGQVKEMVGMQGDLR